MPRAAARDTEGPRDTGAVARGDSPRGRGGRPKGSKNKPKSLIPTKLAEEILLKMEGSIPQEHYTYIRGVIRDGKAISTKRELDVLILLLSRNLMPALVEEINPDPTVLSSFRRDVTDRLKVLNSLLTLRHQVEKREEDDADGPKPLLKVWASRDLRGRLAVLVGDEPLGLAGNTDDAGRGANETRDVSDSVSERPVELPNSEQGSADRILDDPIGGDHVQGGDTEELQG